MQHSPQSSTGLSDSGDAPLIRQTIVPLREQLSALADGDCLSQDWVYLSQGYAESGELQQAWSDYHLIGDALRGQRPVSSASSADFLKGVMAGIADDAAPQPVALAAATPVPVAANDAVFRWKMVAGLASLVAISSVVWHLVSSPLAPAGPQLARSAPPVPDALQRVVTPSGAVMLRDAELDQFMAAHRQWGGMSALQMPAGFLRNATYENPSR
jgi:sigma-E factor negative regulatory protein RseA